MTSYRVYTLKRRVRNKVYKQYVLTIPKSFAERWGELETVQGDHFILVLPKAVDPLTVLKEIVEKLGGMSRAEPSTRDI